MRSEHNIEREIDVARHDLEDNLSELKATVREKLDIKGRLQREVDRRLFLLSQQWRRLTLGVRERPALAIGAVAGMLGVTTLVLIAYARRA
jgi:hypothetical protein